MTKTITAWAKIKCWFTRHDWEVIETKTVTGMIFGRPEEARKYGCSRCGYTNNEWCVTESL